MIEIKDMQESVFEACAKISGDALPKESWKIRDFESAGKNPQTILITASSDDRINVDRGMNNALATDCKASDDLLAGYLVSYFAADEAELTSIAVSDDFRRRGIGKSLMQEYYKRLKEKAVQSIYLEVRESNSTAILFYEEEGFESFSKRPHFYDEPVEDAVLMRKYLD